MEPSQRSKSLEELDRQIENHMRILSEMKFDSEWINEYNKSDKLGNTSSKTPKFNKNISYYEQFWKTYLINEMIILKARELTIKNKELDNIITNAEELLKERGKLLTERHQKKKRRTSSQINKAYKCPYPSCNKRYGCDVSMNLHIKLKHSGGNKTERQQLAICEAELKGLPSPVSTLNFPPGYLQNFKEEYKNRIKKSAQLPRRI